ncbi:hypothetical protein EJA72_07075 [Pseudomonas sp. PB120]|nr:hypothetical protein [Pseudomonas sp. PB120]
MLAMVVNDNAGSLTPRGVQGGGVRFFEQRRIAFTPTRCGTRPVSKHRCLRRLSQRSPFFLHRCQVSFGCLEVPGFCVLRHVAGGMPNWAMNQRVNELAME